MDRVWLSNPHLNGLEQKYIDDVLTSNWIAPQGPAVDAFEHRLSDYVGVANCLATNSGTASIHLALLALGVGPSDLVLCSNLTFIGSVAGVKYVGATPVFIDSEHETWNMCPRSLEMALDTLYSEGRAPKAAIITDLYGQSANYEALKDLLIPRGIPIVEDAAESLGASYNGVQCGALGDIGVLSFNGNKIITTSGGGALLTNSSEQIRYARFLATQAREDCVHYEHLEVGFNYRLSNVLGGLGLAQLQTLGERITDKQRINRLYRTHLEDMGIVFQSPPSDKYFSTNWLTVGLLPKKTQRDLLLTEFAKNNIDARPIWNPMHLQPVFNGCRFFALNKPSLSEIFFRRGICFPSPSNLRDDEFEKILDISIKILSK
jgi:pyridoxal phosphate-dependent aminotransferase EpsN